MASTTIGTGRLKQGQHVDPLDPRAVRDESTWSERRRTVHAGAALQQFRGALCLDGVAGLRAALIDDLSTHFHLDAAECVRRCIDWEQWSVEEWQAHRRDSAEDLAEFYHTVQSWSFDLLWYAYLQAEGFAYPVGAAIAEASPPGGPGRRHLDFGSGIGITSQLFQQLGYESELADVSTSLLDFARFRLERRGQSMRYIDLNVQALEPNRYDVITAVDTLFLVPDYSTAARALHTALKPGGILYANFDTRPPTPENAWHLYSDDLPLRWQLHRIGFEPEADLDGFATRYRRVEPRGLPHALRGVRDMVLLRSPLRPAYRRARLLLQQTRQLRAQNG